MVNDDKLPYKKLFHTFVTYKSPCEKGSNNDFDVHFTGSYIFRFLSKTKLSHTLFFRKNGQSLLSKIVFILYRHINYILTFKITERGWAKNDRTF